MGNSNKLKINKIENEKFEILRIIGKGGFSKIYLVKENYDIFVLKENSKLDIYDKEMNLNLLQEYNILTTLKNPFLLQGKKIFQNNENIYFLFKFLSGGDLRFHLKKKIKFEEKIVKFYAYCILLALDEFHKNNLIHQDIKPENICLDYKGYPYLIDYGVSKPINNNNYPLAGTKGYFSPESILKKNILKFSDYYSLGIVLFELLIGKKPFNGNKKQIKDLIFLQEIKLKGDFTKNCIDFVNGLLEVKIKNRLGYLGIWEILSHPWFTDIDKNKIINKKILPDFIPPFICKNLKNDKKILKLNELKKLEMINKKFYN